MSDTKGADLTDSFTIPVSNMPSAFVKRISFKVQGIDDKKITDDFNQRVVLGPDGFKVDVVRGPFLPAGPLGDLGLLLAEDDYSLFKNDEFLALSKKIIGDDRDGPRVLKRVTAWVNKNIDKKPTLSFPNSLDVMRQRRGDCNEITAFTVALFRAAEIPAYANVGIVYNQGRFFYHAWPSVFLDGAWVDTDPALSQVIADCRRIKLFKGLKGQFEVIKVLGRIKVEVLNYDKD